MKRFSSMSPVVLALGALSILAIAGCGSDNSLGPSANATSQVRTINALEGCPANVDILQASNTVPLTPSGGLTYGTIYPLAGAGNAVDTAYSLVRSGNGVNTNIYSTGTTTSSLAPQVSINLAPHTTGSTDSSGTYTIGAAGVCGGTGSAAPQIFRLQDAYPNAFTGSNANTAAVRLVNLSPDAGNISLYSNGAALSSSSTVSSVPYIFNNNGASTTYLQGVAPLTTPTLSLRNSANATLTLASNQINSTPIAGNHAYTIFVIGEVNPTSGGQPLDARIVQDF